MRQAFYRLGQLLPGEPLNDLFKARMQGLPPSSNRLYMPSSVRACVKVYGVGQESRLVQEGGRLQMRQTTCTVSSDASARACNSSTAPRRQSSQPLEEALRL